MKLKLKQYPKEGDTRIKTRFLLFPKSIYGEIRWLETASWQEQYHGGYAPYGWKATKWLG